MTKEEILKSYHFRHACKEFNPDKKISTDDFNFLLQTIVLSPSSFGLEPWKILSLEDIEKRKVLLPIVWGAQNSLLTASHFLVFLSAREPLVQPGSEYMEYSCKKVRHMSDDIYQFMLQKYTEHYNRNIHNSREAEDWTSKQTYIALGNIMTAAAGIGIDSCAIEGFLKPEVESVLKGFGADMDHYNLSVMLALGYRKEEPHRPKTRKTLEEIFTVI